MHVAAFSRKILSTKGRNRGCGTLLAVILENILKFLEVLECGTQ
jgi:hypothetical protein